MESIPQAVIEAHFEPTWEGEHPLAGALIRRAALCRRRARARHVHSV
ncbi:hypothetical protein P4193_33595 [Pseudomonas aeruginosa]|nr:hypothetical protein [Pseudomonas aeruginosa]